MCCVNIMIITGRVEQLTVQKAEEENRAIISGCNNSITFHYQTQLGGKDISQINKDYAKIIGEAASNERINL